MICDYLAICERWKMDKYFDEITRAEINALSPEMEMKEIQNRFYKELEFGTDGLCGIMGAGTNHMSKYTAGKASTRGAPSVGCLYGREMRRTRCCDGIRYSQ